jgi:hypothetical protein
MRVDLRAVAALLTVLLHLLALAMLATLSWRLAPPDWPVVLYPVGADRLREAGEQIVEVDIHPALATRGLACEGSSYVGVGITADPRTERIILVGDNTPAARAGLRHGDIVLNPSAWREARHEGAVLRLVILRAGVRLEVAVLVGKICIG